MVLPWAIVAGGVIVAASGAGLHLAARGSFASYDAEIEKCPIGCVPSVSVAGQRQQGDAMQGAAMAAYAIGGVALTVGAVLVYLNRLQPYQSLGVVTPQVTVAPLLGPNPGATILVSF